MIRLGVLDSAVLMKSLARPLPIQTVAEQLGEKYSLAEVTEAFRRLDAEKLVLKDENSWIGLPLPDCSLEDSSTRTQLRA
jgi:hypothetical protein